MLKQRVVTALVLVAIMFAALAAPGRWPFALVSLALFAAGAWEWARLNRTLPALLSAALFALVGLGALAGGWGDAAPAALWRALALLWLGGGALVLWRGPAAWPRWPRLLRWLLGLSVLGGAWLALVHARTIGINFMLSMLCLVWMADIAAYFGGRAFGRRKLAPSISPGKSWEGLWSGVAGVLALALVWIWLDRASGFQVPSLYTRLVSAFGWPLAAAALVGLSGLSVVGDLFESLVKRAAGAKDSSRLLPGHGGVLDRVDALLPVMPASLALVGLSAGLGRG
ncbi:MAG: phosphatidate cytidylyltransferase [Rubrivivax sp.]|jgi:phosphatidate cytidylyltransferase|nr:phosphatidate cytidylyltransferase [Rubrivivax sp.]